MNLNEHIYLWLNSFAHQHALFDRFITITAVYSERWIMMLAVLVLLFIVINDHRRHYGSPIIIFKELITIGVSIVTAWAVAVAIKWLVHAPRPFLTLTSANPIFLYGDRDSFPSGHATVFFALATAIYYYNRNAGRVFYIFAVLIALSRVIAGIHYPIDIVVGAAIGILIGRFVFIGIRKILRNKSPK